MTQFNDTDRGTPRRIVVVMTRNGQFGHFFPKTIENRDKKRENIFLFLLTTFKMFEVKYYVLSFKSFSYQVITCKLYEQASNNFSARQSSAVVLLVHMY